VCCGDALKTTRTRGYLVRRRYLVIESVTSLRRTSSSSAASTTPAAVNELQDVKQTLLIARANADADRPAFMDRALVFLNLIRNELFTANPDGQF
jgi:hypothetical protein